LADAFGAFFFFQGLAILIFLIGFSTTAVGWDPLTPTSLSSLFAVDIFFSSANNSASSALPPFWPVKVEGKFELKPSGLVLPDGRGGEGGLISVPSVSTTLALSPAEVVPFGACFFFQGFDVTCCFGCSLSAGLNFEVSVDE